MKKLKEKEIRELLVPLPRKMREQIIANGISEEHLKKEVEMSKQAMKNDLYLGFPWMAMYFGMLYYTGWSEGTIIIFILGSAYFMYFTFKRGTYGMNKKKVKILEEILEN